MLRKSLGLTDGESDWYDSLPKDQRDALGSRLITCAMHKDFGPGWIAPEFTERSEEVEPSSLNDLKRRQEREEFIRWRDERLNHNDEFRQLYRRAGYSLGRSCDLKEACEDLESLWRLELTDFALYRSLILGIRGFVERQPRRYHQKTYRLFAEAENPDTVVELINICRWSAYPPYIDTTVLRVSDEAKEQILGRLEDIESIVSAIERDVVIPEAKERAKKVQDRLKGLCTRVSRGEIEAPRRFSSVWESLSDVQRRVEEIYGSGRWLVDGFLTAVQSDWREDEKFRSALQAWDAALVFKPNTTYFPMLQASRLEGIDDPVKESWDYLRAPQWVRSPTLTNWLLNALLCRLRNHCEVRQRAVTTPAWEERAALGTLAGGFVLAWWILKVVLVVGGAGVLMFFDNPLLAASLVLLALVWKAIKIRDRHRAVALINEPLRVLQDCIHEIEQGTYVSGELSRRLREIEPKVRVDSVVYGLLDLRHGELDAPYEP